MSGLASRRVCYPLAVDAGHLFGGVELEQAEKVLVLSPLPFRPATCPNFSLHYPVINRLFSFAA